MMKLFPIFADLKARLVLVVGGGAVAERKTLALLEASAEVVVGAPEPVSYTHLTLPTKA